MSKTSPFVRFLRSGFSSGSAWTEETQAKAEEFIRTLVKDGELRRKEATKVVAAMVEQGRSQSERFASQVSAEVERQVKGLEARMNEFESKFQHVAASTFEKASKAYRSGAPSAASTATDAPSDDEASPAPKAKKAAAAVTKQKAVVVKKAAATKTATTKTATKTAATTKSAATKTAATTKSAATKTAASVKKAAAKKRA